MSEEEMNKYFNDKYGTSYKRLEELFDFEMDRQMKLLDKLKKLQKENSQLREKIEYLKSKIENKDKWCQLIADIGYDYDGFRNVESLMALIDELVKYALNSRDNYDYEELLKGDKE